MGILKELKIRLECQKSGRSEEYEEYKNLIKLKKSDIERFKKYIEDATKKFEEVKKIYPEESNEYKTAKDTINRWRQSLDEAQLSMQFIRPNSKEDIEYRDGQGEEYIEKLRKVMSPKLDLRFHGTPIYFAEQIIKCGEITSSADRYDGYIKSTDMSGEISASTIDTLNLTINFFSDIVGYERGLPAGCIFAIKPKDKADANYGVNLLHNVNFKENPEQLFGIFTTPENIERVQSWISEAGFPADIVHTFEGFIDAVRQESELLDGKESEEKLGDDIPKERQTTKNQRIKQSNSIFSQEDAKEIAMEEGVNGIRKGKIAMLLKKIKNAIRESRSNFKEDDLEK